jgi:chromosome segregation ATPase
MANSTAREIAEAFQTLQEQLIDHDSELNNKLAQAFSEIETRLDDLEKSHVQLRSELNRLQRETTK